MGFGRSNIWRTLKRSMVGTPRLVALAGVTALSIFTLWKMVRNRMSIREVWPDDARALIESEWNNPDFVVLDVRAPSEFAEGHIPVALNINFNSETFREELGKFDKDKTYLVYSESGERSARAVCIMQDMKFRNVYNLAGGLSQLERLSMEISG
jgi:rhodanese-related sulfurtransferase